MRPRNQLVVLPELFLGLLAIGTAVVVTALIFAGAFHDARHTHDTLSVTGSARKPISSDLVRWNVTVSTEAPTAARAARRLRANVAAVETFLGQVGIPVDAMALSVVTSEAVVERLPHHVRRKHYVTEQEIGVSTTDIDVVETAAIRIGRLIERGIDVSADDLEYISTELTQAKLDALAAATNDARKRADILVHGLGGKLGAMRSSALGVYQITPRDSTDVSDYGVNDTSSREKDVTAVVTATFAVKS
jgi:hypothetical protein